MSHEFKGDVLIKRSMFSARRSDEGLMDHGLLSGTITLDKYAFAWQSADPNGANRTINLPDATTLEEGWQTTIHNKGSANYLEIKDNSGAILDNVLAGEASEVTLIDNSTIAGSWYIKEFGGGTGDEKVKISSNDTTAGYLNGKLVAGSNITLTENNDGGNETLTIASTGGGSTETKCAKSTGQSSTTSSSWKTKVQINETFTGGTYRIHGSALWSNEDTGVRCYIRLYIDSVEYKLMVKELYNFKYADGAYHIYHQMLCDFNLTAGTHNIILQYHTSCGKRMYIKEAYITTIKTG